MTVEFLTTPTRPTLPASCMAFDEGRRCLAPAVSVVEPDAGGYSPACERHGTPADRIVVDTSFADPREVVVAESLGMGPIQVAGYERPGWDEYFDGIAEAATRRADCTRRQVAALLITPRNHIIATGYNGAPAGIPGCASAGACPRGRQSFDVVPSRSNYASGEGACIADHAERNAVMQFLRLMDELGVDREVAMAMLASCRMVVTCEPCPQCYALLAAVGITDVRWPAGTE